MLLKGCCVRILAFIFIIVAFLVKFCTPLLAILFFAVSPLSVMNGERLSVHDTPTTKDGYICPMGIEWKAGSEHYLPAYGFSHSAHKNIPQNVDNPHAGHIMTHDMPMKNDNKTSPLDCPITVSLIVAHILSLCMVFCALVLCFLPRLLKNRLFLTKRILESFGQYYLYPCKQAPPFVFA